MDGLLCRGRAESHARHLDPRQLPADRFFEQSRCWRPRMPSRTSHGPGPLCRKRKGFRSSRGSRGSEGGRRSRTRLQPPGGSRTGRRAARSAEQRSSQVAALRLSLGVTEPFAQVALDIAGGGAASAAHLVLEHRTVIENAYNDVAGPLPHVPPGLVPAVIEAEGWDVASPNLAGAESILTRQIATLIARSRLRNRPWQEQRSGEVFRVLLEDVSRMLENAPGR
eukprot:s980_g19.t1